MLYFLIVTKNILIANYSFKFIISKNATQTFLISDFSAQKFCEISQIGVESQALLSVRIVSMDYYSTKPVQDLDVTYSNFRSSSIKKVPVIRVFGSTLAGQKTCLHLHGIFPYIYVPVPAQAAEGFVYRFCIF